MAPKTSSKSEREKTVIVKRGAGAEHYEERKVYASAYFACRNAHHDEKTSEAIAAKVEKAISMKVKKEKIISSDKIFRWIIEELRKHDDDAAFLYETHRDIS
jgi:transcriptional regulator NrdR family protein